MMGTEAGGGGGGAVCRELNTRQDTAASLYLYPLLGSHTEHLSPHSWMLEEGVDLPEAVEGASHWIGI